MNIYLLSLIDGILVIGVAIQFINLLTQEGDIYE